MRLVIQTIILLMVTLTHMGSVSQAQKAVTKEKAGAEAKWTVFWKTFTTALDAHDTATVAQLTSPNFYDGGGSTIQQWLQSDVYANDKKLAAFKNMLHKGVKNYPGFDPGPYKATGKNKSGDLFFEYKNKQWLFAGVVGD